MAEIELSEGRTTSTANNNALHSGETTGVGSNNVMKATENPLHQNDSNENGMKVHEDGEEMQSKEDRKPKKRGARKTYESINVVITQMTCCNIIGCRGLMTLFCLCFVML